ncbi:MAG TPA: branched-chain amino acid aminotransferase [Tissierellia bacterium]|nr:branched-chain amino acid aminotransferase [Tissierellia bacterium]
MPDINWKELGFTYRKTNCMFVTYWKDGEWDEGQLVEDDKLTIDASATALHYGQQSFEGMKAYRAEDGRILLFRPDMNSKRMNRTAKRLLMPEYPEEKFIEAVKKVVKANEEFIPPYGSGGSLYIRPMQIGIGPNLGVRPAPEYLLAIFVSPVGAYFKGGMNPVNFITTTYDRAAAHGTGQAKCGGNYAASLLPHKEAVDAGYADCIYLDPLTHTKIDEVGAANFFAITKDNRFVTPSSSSILESITKLSLLQAAEDLGMAASQEDVYIDQLDDYAEAGACGTAAVISPIGAITHEGKKHVFYSETEVGPKTKELYDYLTGIQFGDVEDKHGWTVEV